ncbi:MAG: protein translocase subunit SecD [Gammaproteobacteria bacterium]|nr:protein translocase subunit SecD [Gammaproteobacteria bacterium]
MMNKYPLWKNLLVVLVAAAGLLIAMPNLYGEDPAVQVSHESGEAITVSALTEAREVLADGGIDPLSVEVEDGQLLARFKNTDDQLKAVDLLQATLGNDDDYTVALNLAAKTPDWLADLGLQPMNLGLDLRGGVHFLLEVDMDAALNQQFERYEGDFKTTMREERIRYLGVDREGNDLRLELRKADDLEAAERELRQKYPELSYRIDAESDEPAVVATLTEERIKEIKTQAIQQNTITIRNRVNELGVAEPLVQRQGEDRIVVQLPGVQDTARAKKILGATATVEFRMQYEGGDPDAAERTGRVPAGAKLYTDRETGRPVLLQREVIVSGDQLTDATSGFDQNGAPAVHVNLDAQGGRRMLQNTQENLGKRMGVVFIENKPFTVLENGEPKTRFRAEEEIISLSNIAGVFSNRFMVTGLQPNEARSLALLLRAGSLAAPINIVEERTIGPSLGADNIEQGTLAVQLGFLLVIVFMLVYYKMFGLVANAALTINLVLMVAVLSLLQATLTLPGIAGIVLTVGMAVDANVLIFERIREELRAGNTPQAAIHAGYDKAFSTIADANVTTLIAALVLFIFGTGPIKGFAVTLSIGIITSMFTAIVGTRALVNAIYGGRRVTSISI